MARSLAELKSGSDCLGSYLSVNQHLYYPHRNYASKSKNSTRTREALARAKANGKVLGGFKDHVLDAAATARSAEVRKARSAERKAEVLPIVRELQAAGVTSLRAIAHGLNAQGFTTLRGGSWGPAQVRRVLSPAP